MIKMATGYPSLLGLNVVSRIDLLVDAGFERGAVVKMATGSPQMLGRSVQKNIIPKMEFLLGSSTHEKSRPAGLRCQFILVPPSAF